MIHPFEDTIYNESDKVTQECLFGFLFINDEIKDYSFNYLLPSYRGSFGL